MGERIVLGLDDNVDYEMVWDSTVLERLVEDLHVSDSELDSATPVSGIRDLVISILGFLKTQAGGERFVASPGIIEDFAGLFRYKVTIGGTAARAAIAMRKLGHRSALHLITINDHVRKLIPPDSPWVCSSTRDSSSPHLIVQFNAGTRVKAGDIAIRASGADRIIYHSNQDRIALKISPDLASLAADARVFLVSGFNAMQSSALLAERLDTLRGVMRSLPRDAVVFFEDACFHDPALHAQVREALVDSIDVYSLNEDELQGHVGRKVALLDPGAVLEALGDLHRLVPVPDAGGPYPVLGAGVRRIRRPVRNVPEGGSRHGGNPAAFWR